MLLTIGSDAAFGSECAPFENAQRTSYRQIAWADFRGPRPARTSTYPPLVALIATSFELDGLSVALTALSDGRWAARTGTSCVRAYMHKDRSAYLGEYVERGDLAHEQGHFDISHLCARDLAASLARLEERAATPEAAERAFRSSVRRLYEEAVASCVETHERYERETSYGNRRGPQRRWRGCLAARVAGEAGAPALAAQGPRARERPAVAAATTSAQPESRAAAPAAESGAH
jgi:hypothetical protein